MQKITALLALAFVSLIFTGCPYDSAVPIDQRKPAFNTALLGSWMAKSPEGNDVFTVSKQDDFNYRIVERGTENQQNLVNLTAFISVVNKMTYLNMKDDKNATYSFAKIDLSTDASHVTLSFISEEMKTKFSTPAELKTFIADNQAKENFFEKDKLEFEKLKK
jgi:hypothetical protein